MMTTHSSAQLATSIVGEGPDVLLLHAGVADRRAWAPLVERLSATHRCITFDARGHGDTTYEPESFTRVGDAIAVLDTAGSERAILVGNSMGGRTALDLAIAHPDRVAALVLICPAISGMPDGEDSPEARFWLDGINGGEEGRVVGPARDLFLAMNGKALAATDPGDEDNEIDAWAQLEQVSVPTLMVVGELDYPVFTANAVTAAGRLPNAQLVRLDSAGHVPVLEGDETCLSAITEFVSAQA